MSKNNSQSRKAQRRAGALERFSFDQEKIGDEKYLARKAVEQKSLNSSVAKR